MDGSVCFLPIGFSCKAIEEDMVVSEGLPTFFASLAVFKRKSALKVLPHEESHLDMRNSSYVPEDEWQHDYLVSSKESLSWCPQREIEFLFVVDPSLDLLDGVFGLCVGSMFLPGR